MTTFNLSGVKANENSGDFKQPVQPGYQTLTIVSVQGAQAGTGAIGLELEFESDVKNTYSFKQKFWLNNADGSTNKGATAFANVVKAFTGADIPEGINSLQGFATLLVGKQKDVTVGGRRYTTEKDGKRYNNIAPELPFGSFDGERKIFLRGEWDNSEPEVGSPVEYESIVNDPANDLPDF